MISPFAKQEWTYLHSLINCSEYKKAIAFLEKSRLPKVEDAYEDDLYFMEALIRVLIAQGFQVQAKVVLNRVLQRVGKFEDDLKSLLVKLLIYKAQIQKGNNENHEIYKTYRKALDLLEEDPNPSQSDFGWVYLGLSQVEELVKDWEMYLINALECFERDANPYGKSAALNALGIFHGRMNNKELAKEFFQEALTLATEYNDLRRKIGIMNNISVLYYLESDNIEDIEKGVTLLSEGISIGEKIESWEYLVCLHQTCIKYYQGNNQEKKALVHIHRLYEIQEKRKILSKEKMLKYQSLVLQNQILLDSIDRKSVV